MANTHRKRNKQRRFSIKCSLLAEARAGISELDSQGRKPVRLECAPFGCISGFSGDADKGGSLPTSCHGFQRLDGWNLLTDGLEGNQRFDLLGTRPRYLERCKLLTPDLL